MQLAAGFSLLGFGGDLFVRGAIAVARRLGIAPVIIGLTLVAYGTSVPVLVASVQGALIGSPGLAVGNVVGSNILNVFLVLGACALVTPVAAARTTMRRDCAVMVGATLVMVALVLYGSIGRWTGAALYAAFLGYVAVLWLERRGGVAAEVEAAWPRRFDVGLVAAAGGLAAILFGTDLLVRGAVAVAQSAGVPETLIGVTVVAVGSSLPTLTTALIAASRGSSELAFGNVVGSCIFDILCVLGITTLITPIAVEPQIARFDIWVMLASAAALVFAATTRGRVSRREGAVLVALYVAYLGGAVGLQLAAGNA